MTTNTSPRDQLTMTAAVLDARDAYARRYPDTDPERLARAVDLVLAGAVLHQHPDGAWMVQSSTPGGYYHTRYASCSCSDHVNRGVVCKHSIALELSTRARPDPDAPIPYAVTAKADAPLGLPCPRCAVPAPTPASARAVLQLGCCLTCVNAELYGD